MAVTVAVLMDVINLLVLLVYTYTISIYICITKVKMVFNLIIIAHLQYNSVQLNSSGRIIFQTWSSCIVFVEISNWFVLDNIFFIWSSVIEYCPCLRLPIFKKKTVQVYKKKMLHTFGYTWN